MPAPPAPPAPAAPVARQSPAPLGRRPSPPVLPLAPVLRGRSRAARRRVGKGGGWRGVLGGLGGVQVPHVGVNVVDGLGVVVGVVCRDLLDTRGDSQYRLDFWLRGYCLKV